MTCAETVPMPRLLLALSLYCVVAVAHAGQPVANDECPDKSGKPATTTASTDTDTPAPHPATPVPTRAGSGSIRPSMPRWHSLLPGMIR